MKYLKQFSIIIAISFAAEIIKYLVPLPIPASIYGLVILFLLLCTGALKEDSIKESAALLVEIMPVMFIPAAVGLLGSWDAVRPILLPAVVMIIAVTIAVMGVTGRIAQRMIRSEEKRRG